MPTVSLLDLEGQLSLYKAYHFNPINVRIHLFCIPLIIFTAIIIGHQIQIPNNPNISLANFICITYGIYYFALNPVAGILGDISLYFMNKTGKYLNMSFDSRDVLMYAIIVHVFAWIAQFYGHGVHEKRKPALLDNLVQPLVFAPYFVIWELLFMAGINKKLEKRIGARAKKMKDKSIKDEKVTADTKKQ